MEWLLPQRVADWARALPLVGGRLALVLAAVAIAQPAQAARDNALAIGEILNPIVVINEDDMDFGDITPQGADGTVVLKPAATATCTTTGSVIRTGTCRAATFVGDTAFLFLLRVTKPVGDQINLTGPGGATMRLDNFTIVGGPGTIASGSTPTEEDFLVQNGDGSFTVYVGGTLNVAATQRPGVYNGTFEISFNYD